jgi:hypothetical protein
MTENRLLQLDIMLADMLKSQEQSNAAAKNTTKKLLVAREEIAVIRAIPSTDTPEDLAMRNAELEKKVASLQVSVQHWKARALDAEQKIYFVKKKH